MLINYNGESKVIKRICELLNSMSNINFEIVAQLPTQDISTSTIYLVPKSTAGQDNIYDEYINTDGTSQGWELIGDTEIDLSNYYTKAETNALIPDELSDLSDDSTHRLVTDTEKSTWNAKANTSDIKNGTLTIKHNGTTKQTFTANQSTNVDADIEAVDWVSNGILGAKNRLFLPYYTQTSRINDIDVTMYADGSIKLNGTASDITRVYLRGGAGTSRLEPNVFKGMRAFMKYSTGVFNSDCYLYCQPYSSDLSVHDNINDTDGTGFIIPSDNRDLIRLAIYIKKNTVLNNVTVYPMVCLASDKDNTWQTYCLTNKELTDEKIGKWQDLGNWNTTTIGSSMSYSDKYDEFLIRIVGTTYSLDVHILNIAGVITGASGRIYRNYYQSDSQNYMAVNVGLTFGVDTIVFALETGTEEVINGSSQSIQQIRTFAR